MFPQNELMLERISRISLNMNNSYTNNPITANKKLLTFSRIVRIDAPIFHNQEGGVNRY